METDEVLLLSLIIPILVLLLLFIFFIIYLKGKGYLCVSFKLGIKQASDVDDIEGLQRTSPDLVSEHNIPIQNGTFIDFEDESSQPNLTTSRPSEAGETIGDSDSEKIEESYPPPLLPKSDPSPVPLERDLDSPSPGSSGVEVWGSEFSSSSYSYVSNDVEFWRANFKGHECPTTPNEAFRSNSKPLARVLEAEVAEPDPPTYVPKAKEQEPFPEIGGSGRSEEPLNLGGNLESQALSFRSYSSAVCRRIIQQSIDLEFEIETEKQIEDKPLALEPKVEPSPKPTPAEVDAILQEIWEMQENLRGDPDIPGTLHKVQGLILQIKSSISQSDKSTQCNLIIGVDATPATFAGYCVNLKENSLNFYIIKRADLPWPLHDEKDTNEFEMKNLIFALSAFHEDVVKFKRIRLYTDNYAVERRNELYGQKAHDLLEHYVGCEGVTLINRGDLCINKYRALRYYVQYIKAVDDLSRWKMEEGVGFLQKLYNIPRERVTGTHVNIRSEYKPFYVPTVEYGTVLEKVGRVLGRNDCSELSCHKLLETLRKPFWHA